MKLQAAALIDDLVRRTEAVSETVRPYRELDHFHLNFKPHKDSWSILECLEHLNLYGDYYLPEMEKQLLAAPATSVKTFRTGVMGGYFTKLMEPKADGTIKKMQSPKDKQPERSRLSETTIERFLKQQEHLLRLLEMARKTDLKRTKTAISISKIIRLRLGDTFRFYVAHIERHVAQAERLR